MHVMDGRWMCQRCFLDNALPWECSVCFEKIPQEPGFAGHRQIPAGEVAVCAGKFESEVIGYERLPV